MVIILRGISGAGKSSIARNFTTGHTAHHSAATGFLRELKSPIQFAHYSADDYFMVGNDYKFDPQQLPAAHESCLRMFASKLERTQGTSTNDIGLIVDNTNTTLIEVMPYLALAQAYGHEVHVLTLMVDPFLCAGRSTHGASFGSIVAQDLRLKQSILDWPQRFARYQQIFPH